MTLSNVHRVVGTYHVLIIRLHHLFLGPISSGCLLDNWVTDLDIAVIS